MAERVQRRDLPEGGCQGSGVDPGRLPRHSAKTDDPTAPELSQRPRMYMVYGGPIPELRRMLQRSYGAMTVAGRRHRVDGGRLEGAGSDAELRPDLARAVKVEVDAGGPDRPAASSVREKIGFADGDDLDRGPRSRPWSASSRTASVIYRRDIYDAAFGNYRQGSTKAGAPDRALTLVGRSLSARG